MKKHIKPTSRTVGTPPITMSTTCNKTSSFSVAFSALKSERSISKPSLSVVRTALQPANSSLPVIVWLPAWTLSNRWSPTSSDTKTALMESILTLCSNTSEHYLTIRTRRRTACQFIPVRGSLSSLRVVSYCIYRMNNCMRWSSLFTKVLRFMFRVSQVNTYLTCVDAQQTRAGMEGIDRATGYG